MPNVDHCHLMTAAELADRLGVRPGTVHAWHRSGKIPGRRLSHKVVRFDLASVVDALEARAAMKAKRPGGGR